MGHLEVHAHLKIRPGRPEGFKAQAAEIIRLTREKDTQTIRYDWFINEDGTECEVHETYLSGRGSIEHNTHVMERAVLFEKYAYDHRAGAFGEVSQSLRELANKHAGGIAVYSFLQGLEPQRLFRARSKGRAGRSPAILVPRPSSLLPWTFIRRRPARHRPFTTGTHRVTHASRHRHRVLLPARQRRDQHRPAHRRPPARGRPRGSRGRPGPGLSSYRTARWSG